MKRRGFTLIELLVVIAIIAILAAILFPVFARAREAARKSVCLSNVKQICLAEMMYVDDWDGVFPTYARHGEYPGPLECPHFPGYWPPFATTLQPTGFLQPYLKNLLLAKCPSDSILTLNSWVAAVGYSSNWDSRGDSYAFSRDPRWGPSLLDKSTSAVQNPARTVMIAEQNFWFGDGNHDHGPEWFANSSDYWWNHSYDILTIHGSNVGFADGHAKWTIPERTFSSMDADDTEPSASYQWNP